jgi:Uma2 family endonuclease
LSKFITEINDLNFDPAYSYADYLLWKFQERVELIRGKISRISDTNTQHQVISGALFLAFGNHLKNTPYKVFAAPFDVRLTPVNPTPDGKIFNVVQPDIVIICDASKLDARGCVGVPDLVVEILSPGNNKKEIKDKFELYESNGISEYWVVFPSEQTLVIYTLQNGKYEPGRMLTVGDIAQSKVVPDFSLDLKEVFEESMF